jgi:hypothetical protein
MSSFCASYSQKCSEGCCDKYGYCPSDYGTPCYYYYNNTNNTSSTFSFATMSISEIVGISIGCIVFLGFIITLIILYTKRRPQLTITDASLAQTS